MSEGYNGAKRDSFNRAEDIRLRLVGGRTP
jgi:hypothetical protein